MKLTLNLVGEKAHLLGRKLLEWIPEGPMDKLTGKPRVIALICDPDVIVYDTYILAMWRAGFVVRSFCPFWRVRC